MEQRVSLVTLGVSDVVRAQRFYERLGWRGQLVEETVFFQTGQSALVLWGLDELAEDSGIQGAVGAFSGVVLAHNVRSREEVDSVLAVAREAGASVTRPASDTFYGGYAGVFRDPDGHAWEIAYNPGFTLTEDGALALPDFAQGSAET